MTLAELSRDDLFERVWKKPLDDVAEDLGVSRNVLRSRCLKMEVPIPPRGHWSKVASGKRVKRPKLERASKPSLRGNLAAIAAKMVVEGSAEGTDRLPGVLERVSLFAKSQRLSQRALLLRDTLKEREADSSGLGEDPKGSSRV